VRLLSWNVNGLRAIHKKGFLDWFKSDNPDILCLQEIKALEEQLPDALKEVDGYNAFFNPAERKGYSGVAVYSKAEPNSVSKGLGINNFDSEGRVLELEYDDFTLMNIYFPNGGMSEERLQYKMDFYDAFLEYAVKKVDVGHNLIVCGDFNTAHTEIDLARPRENVDNTGFLPMERDWMTKYFNSGFVDTFRVFNKDPGHYTWWDYKTRARERDVGWRLDYFTVNNAFKSNVMESFILKEVMGSDHCPLGIKI